ncbi:MAG: DUF692 domain-containing protein [Myxococcota bacterium]
MNGRAGAPQCVRGVPRTSRSTAAAGLGFGLGLRTPHYDQVAHGVEGVDFFELLSENFMVDGGKPLYYLDAVAERYDVVLHGVSMSIGSVDPPSREYLDKLAALARRAKPAWVSDHLCWTIAGGINSHDLLPLPLSYQALQMVIERVNYVQDVLERPFVLENISTYSTLQPTQMEEWEFINTLTCATGAKVLLDVNNVYVNARNHGFDPHRFLDAIDPDSVQQIHLAGHTDLGDHVIDTHDDAVTDEVLDLYAYTIARLGPVSTSIERDDDIPPLEVLLEELDHVRDIARDQQSVSLAS